MQNEAELVMLFDLLRHIYANQKSPPLDLKTKTAWMEVLRPWDYQQVREAVIVRARTNPYFPTPSEIAVLCPVPADPATDSKYDLERARLMKIISELNQSPETDGPEEESSRDA